MGAVPVFALQSHSYTASRTHNGGDRMTPACGIVALVGSGEYLPHSEPLDQDLLARVGATPRVVVLPTAAAPDGPGVPERWARMGVEHFTRLGAAVAPVMLLTRADAENPTLADQIAAANFVYLSGGKPRYLLETLRDTACWRAIAGVHAAGGVIAGCSAGAMALGGALFDFPQIWRTLPALNLVPGIAVLPHFDEFPHIISNIMGAVNRRLSVVGVDGATALVVAQGQWTVAGAHTVTVFSEHHSQRYTAGQAVPIPPSARAEHEEMGS